MKKNSAKGYVILGILFALVNIIAFAVPTAKTATFWIAYVFTAVAFALQIAIWKFAFKGADTLKSKFLGISLISVGITYLIIQLIAFAIFMAFPIAPTWIAIVVCALILSISAICLIGTETGREEINRVEAKNITPPRDIQTAMFMDFDELEPNDDYELQCLKFNFRICLTKNEITLEMREFVDAEVTDKFNGN